MSREIRKVPADWEHPKNAYGKLQPLNNEYYLDALNRWLKKHRKWQAGTHPDLVKGITTKQDHPFYATWGGNPPALEYFHSRRFKQEELTHIQLYETVSEGTPISPVFPGTDQGFDDLCAYAADNCFTFADYKATKEQWKKMLTDNFVFHQEGNIIMC